MQVFRESPVRMMITGGNTEPSSFDTDKSSLLKAIQTAADAAVDFVQIREKRLHARQLFELAEAAVMVCRDSETRVIINERFDVALASGAAGVHLTSDSLGSDTVKPLVPEGFVIGVSTHSKPEAENAAQNGADYIIYGPIFDTPSKRSFGAPKGIEKLRRLCETLGDFPVFAIGGIDSNNSDSVLDAGAKGYAAIRFFENPETFADLKAKR